MRTFVGQVDVVALLVREVETQVALQLLEMLAQVRLAGEQHVRSLRDVEVLGEHHEFVQLRQSDHGLPPVALFQHVW